MTHNSLQLINPWPSNSRSNWNLEMLVFEEGGKPENPEKNPRSKGENQQQIQSTYDAGSGNRTQDTLVVSELRYPSPFTIINFIKFRGIVAFTHANSFNYTSIIILG